MRRTTALLILGAFLASCAGSTASGPPQSEGSPASAAGDPSPSPTPSPPAASSSPGVTPRAASSDCGADDGGTPSEMSIAALLRSDPRFGAFCRIASRAVSAGLGISWLEIWDWPADRMGDNQDGVTVFVPTNAAFEQLDSQLVTWLDEGLVANDALTSLLGHHYIHWLYPSTDFEPGPQPTRARSTSVELSLDPLTFGGCDVVETDVRVANGYVHVIDCVVVPAEVAEAAP